MYTVIVSSKGQVLIPMELRRRLNIKEGDVLSIHLEEGGRLIIETSKRFKKSVVEQTAGLLSDMEMNGLEYVESIRKSAGSRMDKLRDI